MSLIGALYIGSKNAISVSFDGILHNDILIAEGSRGPRSCYIVADLKQKI